MKLKELPKEYNNINPKAKIHRTVSFYKNGIGIYIAGGVRIGKKSRIYHHVTIGKRHGSHFGVPKIGENTTINSFSCILGDVTIGNNVVVGAYSFILEDVPDNCLVVGRYPNTRIIPFEDLHKEIDEDKNNMIDYLNKSLK